MLFSITNHNSVQQLLSKIANIIDAAKRFFHINYYRNSFLREIFVCNPVFCTYYYVIVAKLEVIYACNNKRIKKPFNARKA